MFDLVFYKKLKDNNYKYELIVQMVIVYEDIILNINNYENSKLREQFIERTKNIEKLIKIKKLITYPCVYSDHINNKSNYKYFTDIDQNLYLIFISNKLEFITTSKSSKEIQNYVLKNTLNNL